MNNKYIHLYGAAIPKLEPQNVSRGSVKLFSLNK